MKFYELNKEITDFLTKQPVTDRNFLTEEEFINLLQEEDLLADENANQAVRSIRSILTGNVPPEDKAALERAQRVLKDRLKAIKGRPPELLIQANKVITGLLNPTPSPRDILLNKINNANTSDLSEEKKAALRALVESYNPADLVDTGELYQQYVSDIDQQEIKKILFYCQAAHIFEENGDALEHAIKLAVVFKTADATIKGLTDFANQTKKGGGFEKDGDFVHQACLFTLPDERPRDNTVWDNWRSVFRNNFNDAEYKNVFTNIDSVHSFYESLQLRAVVASFEIDCNNFIDELNEKLRGKQGFNVEALNRIDSSRPQKNTENLKSIIRMLREHIAKEKAISVRAGEGQERNAGLEKSRAALNKALTLLAASKQIDGQSFTQLGKDEYQGIYNAYRYTSSGAYRLLVEHGLSKASMALFSSLDKSNAGRDIPDVGVLEILEHPRYYMRKLDVVNNEHDAAMAAYLGKITNCCQSIGDAGTKAAEHGLTSPYGGFYVICKKASDGSVPDFINDKVITQSWAWRSTDEGLVFDSVEGINPGGTIIKDFYNEAARILSRQHDVTSIYVGNSPDTVGFGLPSGKIRGYPKDSIGYTNDSARQKILFSKLTPYMEQADGLKPEERLRETQKILHEKLSSLEDVELKNDKFMHFLLIYLVSNRGEITKLSDLLQDSHRDKFDRFIKINCAFVDKLNSEFNFDEISFLINEGAIINLTNNENCNLLHLAVQKPDSLKAALEFFPKSERRAALTQRDNHGCTVLDYAAQNPDSLRAVLESLPGNDRAAALKEGRNIETGGTVLHNSDLKPGLLKLVLELLPEIDRAAILKEKDNDGRTVLHCVAKKLDSLKAALEFLPETELCAALKEKDYFGATVLHHAAKKPDSLKAALEFILVSERCAAVNETENLGDPVWYWASENPEAFKVVLAVYPENERFAVFTKKIDLKANPGARPRGMPPLCSTILHTAANSPDLLKVVVELLPDNDRPAALKEKDNDGRTVLHYAAENPEAFKAVLALLPESERLAAVIEKDNRGNTVLELAAKNPDSLKLMQELLPKNAHYIIKGFESPRGVLQQVLASVQIGLFNSVSVMTDMVSQIHNGRDKSDEDIDDNKPKNN